MECLHTSWFTFTHPSPVDKELEQIRDTHPTLYDAIIRLRRNDATLTKLDLHCQKIGDREASLLAQALAQNTTLLSLCLSYNHIGEVGAGALADVLTVNASLSVLFLNDNHVGDSGAKALADALKVNASLSWLYLNNNQVGEVGASAFAEVLKANRSLTALRLDGNTALSVNINSLLKRNQQFTPQFVQANQSCRDGQEQLAAQRYPEAQQCFARALHIYPEHLAAQAGLNKIPHPMRYNTILRLQQNDPTLTELSLEAANLSDQEVTELANALAKNKTLTSLNLSNNHITEAGAHALASALTTNTMLTSLYLADNQINANSVRALTRALEVNTTLTELDLSDNPIADAGARALAGVFDVNKTLTGLRLANSYIGDDGASALAGVLKPNGSLSALDLTRNPLTAHSMRLFVNALEKNPTLMLYIEEIPVRALNEMIDPIPVRKRRLATSEAEEVAAKKPTVATRTARALPGEIKYA